MLCQHRACDSGDRLRDEQAGEQKFYAARAERILFTAIMAPKDAPEWAYDRNRLWNEAERAEKRKDAQLAREIEVSLPHELTEQQRQFLIKDFAREAFVRKGFAVDIAIHAPDRESDERNFHAHLMVTRRALGPDGFAPTKDWQFDKKQLAQWREDWAHLANRHLERHGHTARIDHRSLEGQGLDREATVHVGYAGMEITQRGGVSDRMGVLKQVLARNGERIELRKEMATIEAELKELERLRAREGQLDARTQAFSALEGAAGADEKTLRFGKAERIFQQDVRAEASHAFHERQAERAEERQAVWLGEQAAHEATGKIRSGSDGALQVVDALTGVADRLADFMVDFLAGSPAPPPVDKRAAMRAFATDPAARRDQQRAATVAARQAATAGKALDNIAEDMRAGRNLKAEDVRNLTRQQQEQIATLGDTAVQQMVDDARKRSERHWRGDERERDL